MKYRVVIYFKTRRTNVAAGMTVEASDEDEAEDIAKGKVLDGYPSRRWIATDISEDRP